jgi:hypothetical protein
MRSVADRQPQRVMVWRQRDARGGLDAPMALVSLGPVLRSPARSVSIKCLCCGNICHVVCPKQGKS